MALKVLLDRIRQLRANEQNAFQIYSDLERLAEGESLKKLFRQIAQDEHRHLSLEEELIALLKDGGERVE